MFEDGEQEITELDIESRTWNKFQKNMKSVRNFLKLNHDIIRIGFRDGAVKGKELSLQEGFNLGYLEGFKLGECLGKVKGILSGITELKLTSNEKICLIEKAFCSLSGEACILCSKQKIFKTPCNDEISFERSEDLILTQYSHCSDMIKTLKLYLQDLKSYLDKE